MTFASLFGAWIKLNAFLQTTNPRFSLPPIMVQRLFNPMAGSMEGLAVFLSIVLALVTGYLLLKKISRKGKIFFGFLILASLFLLLLIDLNRAWIVLAGSLSFFVGFSLWIRIFREDVNKLLLPLLLTILAIFCLWPNVPQVFFGPLWAKLDLRGLPQEIILSQKDSWQVAFRTIINNLENAFLGSGIGTFHYDFAKFKNPAFNQNWFWQLRFDRAGSHIAEILGTMGILGFLAHLGILSFFFLISWFFLEDLKTKLFDLENPVQLFLLIGFTALVIGQLVYYQNITFGIFVLVNFGAISGQLAETN